MKVTVYLGANMGDSPSFKKAFHQFYYRIR